MKERCDCIVKFNAMLKDENTRIQETVLMRGIREGVKPLMLSVPTIAVERIATGRGSKKPVGVVPTFCPFCGTKYPTNGDVDAAASSSTEADHG